MTALAVALPLTAAPRKKATPTPAPTATAAPMETPAPVLPSLMEGPDNSQAGRERVKELRKSFVGKDKATTETLTEYRDAMAAWKVSLEPRFQEVRKEQVEYERALRDFQYMLESSGFAEQEGRGR